MALSMVAVGQPHVAAHNAERTLINAIQAVTDSSFTTALTGSYLALAGAQNISGVKTFNPTLTSSSGMQTALIVSPTINQTGTAGYHALRVDVTETAVGSGAKNLLMLSVGGVSKLAVGNSGYISQANIPTAGDYAFSTKVAADTLWRFILTAGGVLNWGPGGAATVDTYLYRASAGVLKTDGQFNALSYVVGSTASFLNAGTLQLANAGNNNIEIGRVDGVAGASFIDFHSGATVVDYDARIIASGGSGALGGGQLTTTAAYQQHNGTLTSSSSYQTFLHINPTVNQTGTAGYAGIYMEIVETATGSGSKRIIDARVGGVSRFSVERTGTIYSSYSTASEWAQAVYVGSETNPRFVLASTGSLNWGPGGSTTTDTSLSRSAPGQLLAVASIITTPTFTDSSGLPNAFTVQPTINQTGTAGYRGLLINVTQTATGSGPKQLIEALVGGTSRFVVSNIGTLWHNTPTAGDWAHTIVVNNEAQPRYINSGGQLNWGPGGSTAVDTSLYRSSPGMLYSPGGFNAASGVWDNSNRVFSAGNRPITIGTPASSSAAGSPGQEMADSTYYYVCVSTNSWRRIALSTF